MVKRLSNNECKQIASLKVKKYRLQKQLFLVEGEKLVREAILSGNPVKAIVGLEEWWHHEQNIPPQIPCMIATANQMKQISQLVTPPPVIAVVRIPQPSLQLSDIQNKITLVLENIQDPGNLGTIIRLADWYGVENIICSPGSVEAFNAKVIQSSMGSIFRVKIHYAPLDNFLNQAKNKGIPIIGAFLEGKNLYSTSLPSNGILLMGNESKGISDRLAVQTDKQITIPATPALGRRAESLNVALATAIICSEWMRQIHWNK